MSGLIPQHFIDDLVARADITEVIGRRVQLKKAGREFKACCPFHDEKTPSFTVSPGKGFYHCFGCGAHGTALGFLMDHDHFSFVEAVEELARQLGMEVPKEAGQKPAQRYDDLFELMNRVDEYYQAELRGYEPAIEYLKTRGLDGPTAKRFGIGYAPAGWDGLLKKFGIDQAGTERLHAAGLVIRKDNGNHYDRFRDRIMFPIRDARGRCIGFGGRVMGDDEPKYLNSPETVLFHKGRELYGLYEARQALRDITHLVVVEGYMDVAGLARHGIDFAVATLGTATTDEHLNRLFRMTDNVSFCFDGDRAGRKAAWRALENALPQVREGRQIRFVFLPDGQDPDSLVKEGGAKAFEDALDDGLPLSEFLVTGLARDVDLSSVDGKAKLAESARPLIQKVPPGVYLELLLERLGESVGLSSAKLSAMLLNRTQHTGQHQARPVQRPARPGQPSAIRRAVTLLLNYPHIGKGVNTAELAGVDKPGAQLLRELIEITQAEPNITTAGLIERFRSREDGRHLGKLAAVELPAEDEFDPATELGDAVTQISDAGRKERIRLLVEKQRDNSLTPEQLEELKALYSGHWKPLDP